MVQIEWAFQNPVNPHRSKSLRNWPSRQILIAEMFEVSERFEINQTRNSQKKFQVRIAHTAVKDFSIAQTDQIFRVLTTQVPCAISFQLPRLAPSAQTL
jgi:hypothetical protein